jgi:hypothetical protein
MGDENAQLRQAAADVVASTGFPLGLSQGEFEAWYRGWWPEGQQAKPATGAVVAWFLEAEVQVHARAPLSENSEVVLALVAEMRR